MKWSDDGSGPDVLPLVKPQIDHDAEVIGGVHVVWFHVEESVAIDPPRGVDENRIKAPQADPIEMVRR
jgi:hypothetical protein